VRFTRTIVAALAFSTSALAIIDAAAEPVTLRIDWLYTSYHAPFFLGLEKGWYREAGIDLAIKEGRGSGNVVQLVGNGSDMFGFAGADAVVRGVQQGVPVVSVASIMPRNADVLFVLASSGITTVGDLKGKRIGSTPGGTSDALLPAFLRGAGLAPGDVTIVPIDAQLKPQMVLQGRIDAMNAPAWGRSILAPGGEVRAFAYAAYGVEVVGYTIVASADTVKSQPDLVSRFVAATLKSWAYAVDHPDEALAALIKHVPDRFTPERRAGARTDLVEALGLVKPAVPGKPFGAQSDADWERMQKQLLDYGVIKQTRPVDQYLTHRFVR
jgi:NitT/TauT family transport system substrate-binding protein